MNVRHLETEEDVAREAAAAIVRAVRRQPDLLFCAATGNSPTKTYALLQKQHAADPDLFSRLRVIKLDEWGGLPMSDPGTCEVYLQRQLLGPLNIPAERYISFHSDVTDPVQECQRVSALLRAQGPIGYCVLGIGRNGHIALNEPAESLKGFAHVAALAETSAAHTMLARSARPPYGVSLGMEEIFSSAEILLLVTGEKKRTVTTRLLQGDISTSFPASLLRLHAHVTVLTDRAARPV